MDVSAVEYINKDVCRCLRWNGVEYLPKDKNPYPFLAGKTFTEEQLDQIIDGQTFGDEIKAHGEMITTRLLDGGKTYFASHRIPMEQYKGEVVFHNVTCTIIYTHSETGANLSLQEVYFNAGTGEILQAILSF